uniref:Testis expressed 264, ER-phagy receptor n=1 Tax=Gadus morhua TaxID=8049 RepID=A0A8C5CY52_GADMO
MSEWAFLCIILSVLGTIVGFVLYLRNVSEIIIRSGCPPIKNITLAYKFKEGPYREWEQVLMECRSIEPKVANIRVLYDDPKKAEGGRYAVGSVLCEGGAGGSVLGEGDGTRGEELGQRFTKAGFQLCSFPEITYAVSASCPHGTPLSFLLGARHMYTRLEDYIKERKLCAHPYVEVYSLGRVQYMVPLARQGDFYVPELRQSERRVSAGELSGSESDVSGRLFSSGPSDGLFHLKHIICLEHFLHITFFCPPFLHVSARW